MFLKFLVIIANCAILADTALILRLIQCCHWVFASCNIVHCCR